MADLLLAGVELQPLVNAIHEDLSNIEELSDLPPTFVRFIRESFERVHFIALDEFILKAHEAPMLEDELIERMSLVLMPEVFIARESLLTASRVSADQIDEIRALCRGPLGLVLAFERGYDLLFPRLRVHLKYAAARIGVSPPVFAEIILRLEGVDPEVTSRITEYFDGVDINSLMSTLRHYQRDQRVIELHLEGYSAKDVAAELFEITEELSGHELGLAVLAVFAIPTPQRPNPRIPQDINWMDEMSYQVLLAYHRDYGVDLMDECRSKGVEAHQLEELTGRVFGMEATSIARELYTVIKANKDGAPAQEPTEQRLCSYVESRGARYRARLMRAYNAYWAHHPGFESLLDDVANFFRDSTAKKKLHALLLGAGADGKSRKVVGVVPIQ
jgi:hypothetical protein